MRCKPGDVAMVVAPYTWNGRGAIVTVLRVAVSEEVFVNADGSSTRYLATPNLSFAWVVEGHVMSGDGIMQGPLLAVADECLKPFPPNLLTDADRLVEKMNADRS